MDVTLTIPEEVKKEIENIVKLGLFKDVTEFVNFAILKTILEFRKLEFNKEEFDKVLNVISKSFNDLNDEEREKLIKEAIEWARKS